MKRFYNPMYAYIAKYDNAIPTKRNNFSTELILQCKDSMIVGPYKTDRKAREFAQQLANRTQKTVFVGFYSDSSQLYADKFSYSFTCTPDNNPL